MQFTTCYAKILPSSKWNFLKISLTKNPSVVLSLMNSCCTPILLYGLEALKLNVSIRNDIDFVYNTIFAKIFKVSDKNVISLCQYYTEYVPASCLLDLQRMNFFNSVNELKDSLPFQLNKLLSTQLDVEDACKKYALTSEMISKLGKDTRKLAVRNWFESSILNLL